MEDKLQLGYVNYKQGAYIVMEGKENNGCFFIIHEGKVITSKEAVLEEEGAETLGPGDFIGVISVMASQSHIETAMALSDVILIKVPRDHYIELIKKNAPVAMKIIMQFSKRLRHLDKTLAKLALQNTSEEGPPHLFDVAEYFFNQKQYSLAFHAYTKYLEHCPAGENTPAAREKLKKLANRAEDLKTGFSEDQLNRLYEQNTMIFAEGEPGDEVFIIQWGSVKITKIVDNNEVVLAILNAGDIFGEMALLDDRPRLASAVAYSDTNLVTLNKANFEKIIYNQPQLIAKVTTLLADRIWIIYKRLVNTLINDPMGRIYDTLLIQLEKNRVPLEVKGRPSSYTFYFGWPELLSMAGLPSKQSDLLLSRIKKNPKIQILENEIHIVSVLDIVRQAEYHRKIDKKDKIRQGKIREY
ncbi:MAG: cyclic nucleotide-binding domain-containing protein [Treponema sp.]|nr:cyclic nucleotide-binding domain-containing protein [Treponema sp.]